MTVREEAGSNTGAGGVTEPVGEAPIVEEAFHGCGEAFEVVRVDQQAIAVVDDLVLDTADRLATIGRAFHIASVTVSPNPSTRLFCTTR